MWGWKSPTPHSFANRYEEELDQKKCIWEIFVLEQILCVCNSGLWWWLHVAVSMYVAVSVW